MKIKRK